MLPEALWFDREGRPIDVAEMVRLSQDPGYRVVARDWVGGVEVATVWLGFDHSFRSAEPVIFETVVFGGRMDQYSRRYTTEEQAVAGHARVLASVQRLSR
ncbi:MAG: hypothetical protein M3P85_16685 [Actinomycetota bacterium]|jgi:hypothetical protein|nr:hypothetical protein [Actinomycetota bacterium]PLS76242.1 MAG: hypothetical protein CYG61_03400 [Actinomycetota bacterium]